MIAALLAKAGLEAGVKSGGRLLGLAVIAACILLAGLCFWRGIAAIERMVESATTKAVAKTNAEWRLQIEAANAEAERERAQREAAAAAASAIAQSAINDLTRSLAEYEARNETRPDAHAQCLSADDVGELNRLRQRKN